MHWMRQMGDQGGVPEAFGWEAQARASLLKVANVQLRSKPVVLVPSSGWVWWVPVSWPGGVC